MQSLDGTTSVFSVKVQLLGDPFMTPTIIHCFFNNDDENLDNDDDDDADDYDDDGVNNDDDDDDDDDVHLLLHRPALLLHSGLTLLLIDRVVAESSPSS